MSIGRRAVQSFLAWARARGHERATLSVVPENRAAIGLYASLGFRDTGRVHDGEAVYEAPLAEAVPAPAGA